MTTSDPPADDSDPGPTHSLTGPLRQGEVPALALVATTVIGGALVALAVAVSAAASIVVALVVLTVATATVIGIAARRR